MRNTATSSAGIKKVATPQPHRKQLAVAGSKARTDGHKRVGLLRPRQGQLAPSRHDDGRHDGAVSFPFTFHRSFAIQGCLGVSAVMFLMVELVLVFGAVRGRANSLLTDRPQPLPRAAPVPLCLPVSPSPIPWHQTGYAEVYCGRRVGQQTAPPLLVVGTAR